MTNIIRKATNTYMEIWKDIEGYEGLYQVSNKGRVMNVRNGKLKALYYGTGGYKRVMLWKNNESKNYSVHRLVAKAFIPNPDNLPQVNHKDECNTNNVVENLEWCTVDYNLSYGTRVQRIIDKQKNGKRSKKVYQYTISNELVCVYPSLAECGRNGYDIADVSKVCHGVYKQYNGYRWSHTPL